MNIARIALRNIFRNKWRSLLSLSAVALVTFAIVFMFAFMEGLRFDQRNTVAKFVTGDVRVRNAGYEKYQFTNPEAFMVESCDRVREIILAVPGVTEAEMRLTFHAQAALNWETINKGTEAEMRLIDQTVTVAVISVDFKNETAGFFSLSPYLLHGGRLPGDGEILVSSGFAEKHRLKPGDEVVLFSGTGSRDFTVCGIIGLPLAQLNLRTIVMPLASAQDLENLPDRAEEILIRLKPEVSPAAGAAAVRKALADAGFTNLEAKPWDEIGFAGTYIDLVSKSMSIMALFFFVLGTTVIVNTTMMVIYERMREIGTLRAMGMRGSEMIRLFFLEAFFIGAAAAGIGVLLGAAFVAPLSVSGIDFGRLADLSKTNLGVSDIIYPQLDLVSTVIVFVYSVAVTSLITFIPTRRAAKIEPIEALRSV